MQRKLTAILSADVVGYSGLMEADETGTLERLKTNRSAIFDPQVASHGGRVFKLLGDGALVEFSSVVAAVNCALAIQEATEKAGEADAKPIRYRIGINLGEVIIEGDDIYGDGVNVAARIQMLAPEGGVALSRLVRDQVKGKLPFEFDDMGEHTVKNIETPVHVFSVGAAISTEPQGHKVEEPRKVSICVLPFANMSGDVEQEYFSDGICEDIITDLSKVSVLFVVARHTAFQFKGKSIDVAQVARQLKVSNVLEGSVRKAAGRVRISAQLIDGATGGHIWAERYDRDLNDIFALQDEISEAIVAALKLKLLPQEKKAIARRGTESVEAYNLYLMARQDRTTNYGDPRREEGIIRICSRAIEIDPGYADAWTLMGGAQLNLLLFSGKGDGGLAAAERALAINADLADAHAVRARILNEGGLPDEANAEIETALRLDPESWEVNRHAAMLTFRQQRLVEAIRYFEKASALLEADFASPAMLMTAYTAIGDHQSARRAAQMTHRRCEIVIAQDRNNGSAMGFGADALAVLGDVERAKEWMNRALLVVGPENDQMRYNLACTLAASFKDRDAALEMLGSALTRFARGMLNHAKIDPDLESLRDDPRYKSMIEAAEVRLAAEEAAANSRP